MKKLYKTASLLVLLLILGSTSCTEQKEKNPETNGQIRQKSPLRGFALLNDFEDNKSTFTRDSLPMDDFSTEGGDLVIYNAATKKYRVFDFWLYGESGRLHYTYWTDPMNKFLFVKRETINFDKPYYENGVNTDTLVHYFSYDSGLNTLYGKSKQEIKNPEKREAIKGDIASFFYELTATVELPVNKRNNEINIFNYNSPFN